MNKREKLLIGIAGIVLVVFAFNYFVCEKQKNPQSGKSSLAVNEIHDSEKPIVSNEESKDLTPKKDLKKFQAFTSWGRDPFAEAYRLAKLDITANDSTGLILKGIIRKGSEAHVLIGDEILKAGEKVGDLKVLDIESDRVVCKIKGKIVTLLLKADEIL